MTIDIERLRALAEKATPGPWRMGSVPSHAEVFTEYADDLGRNVPIADCDPYDWQSIGECRCNAAYIAAANPAVMLELLDRLLEAEAMLERKTATDVRFDDIADRLARTEEAIIVLATKRAEVAESKLAEVTACADKERALAQEWQRRAMGKIQDAYEHIDVICGCVHEGHRDDCDSCLAKLARETLAEIEKDLPRDDLVDRSERAEVKMGESVAQAVAWQRRATRYQQAMKELCAVCVDLAPEQAERWRDVIRAADSDEEE